MNHLHTQQKPDGEQNQSTLKKHQKTGQNQFAYPLGPWVKGLGLSCLHPQVDQKHRKARTQPQGRRDDIGNKADAVTADEVKAVRAVK